MKIQEKELLKVFQHPLFRDVNREVAVEIFSAHECTVSVFSEHDLIHSPSTLERKVGFLLEGEASVTTKDPAKNALLRFLRCGDLFGIANLFTDEPFVSVVRAEKRCRVFFLTEAAIRALLEKDRSFLYHYIGFLSNRICYLNQKISYLTAGSAERRVALYLSSLDADEIHLDASLSSLSELLDIGRASLYRAFDRLESDGYIKKDGRCIVIYNMEAMLKAYQ